MSVSMETMSPDSTVSLGGSFGSSHPHCTESGVAVSRWVFGAASATAAVESMAATSATACTRFLDMVGPLELELPGDGSGGEGRSARPARPTDRLVLQPSGVKSPPGLDARADLPQTPALPVRSVSLTAAGNGLPRDDWTS